MDSTERAAIATTLETSELLARVREVVGGEIGDPLNVTSDSEALRERFDLIVEFTQGGRCRCTVFASNDETCAAVKTNETFGPPHWARRAICVAVASMWTPSMRPAPTAQAAPAAAKEPSP